MFLVHSLFSQPLVHVHAAHGSVISDKKSYKKGIGDCIFSPHLDGARSFQHVVEKTSESSDTFGKLARDSSKWKGALLERPGGVEVALWLAGKLHETSHTGILSAGYCCYDCVEANLPTPRIMTCITKSEFYTFNAVIVAIE